MMTPDKIYNDDRILRLCNCGVGAMVFEYWYYTGGGTTYYVECNKCSIRTNGYDRLKHAIEAWNKQIYYKGVKHDT